MLVNEYFANREVATAYGKIKFDDKGQSKDLTAEQQKELGKLPGFKYVADKAKKEEAKKEEKKAETGAKKTAAKKSTSKKTAAKKDEAKKEEK